MLRHGTKIEHRCWIGVGGLHVRTADSATQAANPVPVRYVVSTELDRMATEAEADRLAGIFEQIRLLAQAQRFGFIQAGGDAVAKGLVTASDWALVREAVGQ